MSFIDIPEWEIEEAIIRNPELLDLSNFCKNINLVSSQYYLSTSGRFIDLLYRCGTDYYIIVELKKGVIDDVSIITEQVLPYREELSNKLEIDKENIICVLATIKYFSSEVTNLCKSNGIHIKTIDEKKIYKSLPYKTEKLETKKAVYRIFKRRHPEIDVNIKSFETHYPDLVRSIEQYIEKGIHDNLSKKLIAKSFEKISKSAPLCSHEVFTRSYDQFENQSSFWFWLFYSVLDRRANASTFVKAARYLEDVNLYLPEDIIKEVKRTGKNQTIYRIRDILKDSNFPLASDSSRLDLAMPSSIVEAAIWYSKYDFSFKIVKQVFERKFEKSERTKELLKDLKRGIYGVGDRIAGQIVRGLILKDRWEWDSNIKSMLEKCPFNITFASYPRIRLINDDDEYYEGLSNFADLYLHQNYCIVSHVLWFIRKRYCGQPKRCYECPLSGYCNYYYRSCFWKVRKHELTLFDLV